MPAARCSSVSSCRCGDCGRPVPLGDDSRGTAVEELESDRSAPGVVELPGAMADQHGAIAHSIPSTGRLALVQQCQSLSRRTRRASSSMRPCIRQDSPGPSTSSLAPTTLPNQNQRQMSISSRATGSASPRRTRSLSLSKTRPSESAPRALLAYSSSGSRRCRPWRWTRTSSRRASTRRKSNKLWRLGCPCCGCPCGDCGGSGSTARSGPNRSRSLSARFGVLTRRNAGHSLEVPVEVSLIVEAALSRGGRG